MSWKHVESTRRKPPRKVMLALASAVWLRQRSSSPEGFGENLTRKTRINRANKAEYTELPSCKPIGSFHVMSCTVMSGCGHRTGVTE